jgi:hypothetical protein
MRGSLGPPARSGGCGGACHHGAERSDALQFAVATSSTPATASPLLLLPHCAFPYFPAGAGRGTMFTCVVLTLILDQLLLCFLDRVYRAA